TIVGTELSDVLISTASPRCSSMRCLPSNATMALVRLVMGFTMRSVTESGKISGRNDSVCGQIGVINIDGTFGWTIEPPADSYKSSTNETNKRKKERKKTK